MKIAIINGPNLNLLGKREPDIYGSESFEDYFQKLAQAFPQVELLYFQSNLEGELITAVQTHGFSCDGLILNAGGYTHTSVALGDAVAAVPAPTIEVHISNVHAREPFRHLSHLSGKCKGSIVGLGLAGYALALQALLGSPKIQ